MREQFVPKGRADPGIPPLLIAPVYQNLRAMILSGRLPPGTKLPEEELARHLNVSRTPLREAIARLAQERLVNSIPRRGAFIVNFNKQEIIEILTLRAVLEGLAARLAAERISDEDLAEMTRLFSPKNVREGQRNPVLLVNADQHFHELILRSTGNSRLQDVMLNLNDQMQLVRRRTIVLAARLERSVKEHLDLLDALRRRDAKGAEAAALRHVTNVLQAVRDLYEDEPTAEAA